MAHDALRGSRRGSPVRGLVWLAPLMALVTANGCYTYQPLAAAPEPGISVGLTLNDRGRAELTRIVGPEIMRVDGTVLDVNDTAYRLAVIESVGLRGAHSRWSGETVDFRRDYVQALARRQFSRPRTLLAVLAGTAAISAFIFSRELFGLGGEGSTGVPPWGGGNEQ